MLSKKYTVDSQVSEYLATRSKSTETDFADNFFFNYYGGSPVYIEFGFDF